MLRLESVVEIASGSIVDADLSEGQSACYIVNDDDVCSLVVRGDAWASWNARERAYVRKVRWSTDDRVLVWHWTSKDRADFRLRSFGRNEADDVPVDSPRDLIVGERVIYVSYGEDQYFAAVRNEIAWQLVAAIDRRGDVLFGLGEALEVGGCDGAIDVDRGCVSDGDEGLFMLYPSDDLWSISPHRASVRRIGLPERLRTCAALAAKGASVYVAAFERHGIVFRRLDRRSGEVDEVGVVTTEALGLPDGSAGVGGRIRGCRDGTMVLMSDRRVWAVSF
ncbi:MULTISPECIES: hypothetical protein [unclassified Bradyrhizobium]|uniref:hypothetical protein n=1 Tax=Bradyrhizobium TaxID=374 RepID=UPI0028E30214|nr:MULTISPECIES: hypothetical protein [unclassified Bradyrhizobium]